jgi:hypothetical protein
MSTGTYIMVSRRISNADPSRPSWFFLMLRAWKKCRGEDGVERGVNIHRSLSQVIELLQYTNPTLCKGVNHYLLCHGTDLLHIYAVFL